MVSFEFHFLTNSIGISFLLCVVNASFKDIIHNMIALFTSIVLHEVLHRKMTSGS